MGFLLSISASIVAIVGITVFTYRRDYIAIWKGHRIQIVVRAFGMDVMIDNTKILENSKKNIQLEHTFPTEGTQAITISPHRDSNGYLHTMQIAIGNEVLSVYVAPLNLIGNTQKQHRGNILALPPPKTICDDRWEAAKRLYERIRVAVHQDSNMMRDLDSVFVKLTDCFHQRQQLLESLKDYEKLGTDTQPVESLLGQQDALIHSILTGLQEMHISIIQVKDLENPDTLTTLRDMVQRMQVQVELEQFSD